MHYARGIAHGAKGSTKAAREDLAAFDSAHEQARGGGRSRSRQGPRPEAPAGGALAPARRGGRRSFASLFLRSGCNLTAIAAISLRSQVGAADRLKHNVNLKQMAELAADVLLGEVLYREGALDAAFKALRRAVRKFDALPYDEPHGWLLSARQTLGALLTEAGRSVASPLRGGHMAPRVACARLSAA